MVLQKVTMLSSKIHVELIEKMKVLSEASYRNVSFIIVV
jgi:hypothetical protein